MGDGQTAGLSVPPPAQQPDDLRSAEVRVEVHDHRRLPHPGASPTDQKAEKPEP